MRLVQRVYKKEKKIDTEGTTNDFKGHSKVFELLKEARNSTL
jgi:hypothetical protein